MYHSFLIHSSADGHLGCFHVLAIIISAVMNIGGTCVSFNSGFDLTFQIYMGLDGDLKAAFGLNE